MLQAYNVVMRSEKLYGSKCWAVNTEMEQLNKIMKNDKRTLIIRWMCRVIRGEKMRN